MKVLTWRCVEGLERTEALVESISLDTLYCDLNPP